MTAQAADFGGHYVRMKSSPQNLWFAWAGSPRGYESQNIQLTRKTASGREIFYNTVPDNLIMNPEDQP